MSTTNQPLFERLTRLLDPLNPAELHGLLCGLLCADRDLDREQWLIHAREQLTDDVQLAEPTRDLLLKLFEYGAAQLNAPDWTVTPLLPDDDTPLRQRADALGIWCQGLLYGLGLGEVERRGELSTESREFLRDAADSKQLHTAHAAGAGLTAAYLAQKGFTGARRILEGPQGLAAGMSSDADVSKLTDGLGTRWATAETSFKFHASCRHTHPAADALQQVLATHGLKASDVRRVTALVHQGAIDVLGPVTDPQTVHQSKFSMGTVLGLVAVLGRAGLSEFDASFKAGEVAAFHDKVVMALDPEVDAAYPARWIGKVRVETTDGRVLHGRVDEPKGDPGNTLSRAELEDKALRLALYHGGASEAEMRVAMARLWDICSWSQVGLLLP
jgi:uncharacterized protein YgfB (UPF0149 family)